MGFKAINWAYKQATGGPLAKGVLLRLADYANESNEAWPSVAQIARDTEMSARSVIRFLAQLERMGLITITPRIEDGRQTSNLYKLNLPSPDSQTVGGDVQSSPHRHRDRDRVTAGQTNIDEPSIEPSLNLPAGVAPACAAAARRLAEWIGQKQFDTWYGDAEFLAGPPITIRMTKSYKANYVRQRHAANLERAFGGEVVVELVAS